MKTEEHIGHLFISVPMMELIEDSAPGCIIQLLSSFKTWKIHMLGFVIKNVAT